MSTCRCSNVSEKIDRLIAKDELMHHTKTPKTDKDIHRIKASLAQTGEYPVDMDDCYVIGLSGHCNIDCPIYLAGKCEDCDE